MSQTATLGSRSRITRFLVSVAYDSLSGAYIMTAPADDQTPLALQLADLSMGRHGKERHTTRLQQRGLLPQVGGLHHRYERRAA
jgi:hypothetical protein